MILENSKIFVEGVTDVEFLKDFISFTYNKTVDDSLFVKTGGYGGLFNENNLNQLRLVNDNVGVNLVIFDANGSFRKRKEELESKAVEHSIDMKLFLFPSNAKSGDREMLLQQIARQDKYIPFATCFDSYMSCLVALNEKYKQKHNSPLSQLPNRKVAIHNYLRLYGQESNEKKRNYTDVSLWDLTHESLRPLNDFLRPYFDDQTPNP